MAFVVIYDACVLYPAPLRDLLIRVARAGVVRAQWSNLIGTLRDQGLIQSVAKLHEVLGTVAG